MNYVSIKLFNQMNKQEVVLKVKKFAMINFLKSRFIEMLNKNDLIYLTWKKEIIAFSWYDLDISLLLWIIPMRKTVVNLHSIMNYSRLNTILPLE